MRAIRATLAVRNHVGIYGQLPSAQPPRAQLLSSRKSRSDLRQGGSCWRKRLFNRNGEPFEAGNIAPLFGFPCWNFIRIFARAAITGTAFLLSSDFGSSVTPSQISQIDRSMHSFCESNHRLLSGLLQFFPAVLFGLVRPQHLRDSITQMV